MALRSTSKKSGFVYKPRTVEQVKGRASRKSGLYDSIFKQGFDTYRPKQGDNLIRYLPPTWDDSDHYGYTAFVHRNIGPDNATYLCPRKMLNKPCPICEAQKEAKDAGEGEEATALTTSERIISWVVDRDADDPEKPLIYDTSWTQDRDIVSLCVNERTGEILMIDHPDKGYDVTIKRTGTGLRTKYFGYAISRDDCPINDSEKVQEEILDYVKDNPIPDVLNFYDYDYLAGVLSGKVAAKDEVLDKDVDEEDAPPPRPKLNKIRSAEFRHGEDDEAPFEEPTTRRGPRRDQELDEEPAPRRTATRRQVEEVDDEPPPSRRSTRRSEPEDVEVDEEADDAPRSRSTGRTRVVEEVDEEDAPPPRRSATTRRA